MREEILAFFVAAHGRSAPSRRPHGRDHRANHQILALDFLSDRLQFIFLHVDADVRVEKEDVDPIELDAVDLGFRSQVEHGVQVNAWFGARAALANQAGPHGVVEFGKIILGLAHN